MNQELVKCVLSKTKDIQDIISYEVFYVLKESNRIWGKIDDDAWYKMFDVLGNKHGRFPISTVLIDGKELDDCADDVVYLIPIEDEINNIKNS